MLKTVKDYFRYLPVSERGRQWGLYATGAGFAQIPPGSPYPRTGHPASHDFAWKKGRVLHEYAIVYISDGEGRFQSQATGERPAVAGTVILLFPDVWHRYRPLPHTGWVESWVCFAGEQADRLLERGFISPELPLLKTGRDEGILHAFTTLLDRLRVEPMGFEQLIAVNVLEIIAAALSAARRQETGGRQYDLVRRAKMILENQMESPPVIEDVAAGLGLSPSRLRQLFKEHTGLSPYQYHLQLKIQRAQEMLSGSDLPVKQIARILRFESVYHFSSLFKRKAGRSPSEWRARGQGDVDPAATGSGRPPRADDPHR
jgi:AraC-like DNA-binding protein